MRPYAVFSLVIGVLFLTVTAVYAQHTPAAKFDLDRPLSVTGIVTQIEWTNPNVHVLMKVPSPTGPPALWAVELESEVLLSERGWTEAALPLGQTIEVTGFAPRDGTDQILGDSLVIESTGVSVFVGTNGILRPKPEVTGETPRKENGQPRLGAVPGEGTGYWGNPSRTAMVEDGVDVDMDPYGLLADIADAPKVAPMQPWALGIYEARQKTFLASDPMFLKCLPPAGPRQFEQVYGFQFVEQPTFDRVFVFLGSGNRNRRIIYTDNREQVGQINGNDTNPVFYGQSIGHWDGDSFVSDTIRFNEEFWFDNGGLPHTEQLQLIERFTRTSEKTMEYHVTVIDPGAYTRPWTSSWTLEWIPGDMPYFLCQDERP